MEIIIKIHENDKFCESNSIHHSKELINVLKPDNSFALLTSGRKFYRFGKDEITILNSIKLSSQINVYSTKKSYKFLIIGYDNCIEYIYLDIYDEYDRKNKGISRLNPCNIILELLAFKKYRMN